MDMSSKKIKKKQKIQHIPQTLQDSIPYVRVFEENGIFEIKPGEYSKSYYFPEINFRTLNNDNQIKIAQAYSTFISAFPQDTTVEVTIYNKNVDIMKFQDDIMLKMKNDGFTFRKRARSFKFAFNGIKLLITKEHNAWIHCFAAVCVLIAGMVFGLSRMEWIAVTIVIGAVLAAEAVNSSIEALADLVSPEYNEAIKRTKDLAAGAVLLMAIAAAIVGFIIFIPKIATIF